MRKGTPTLKRNGQQRTQTGMIHHLNPKKSKSRLVINLVSVRNNQTRSETRIRALESHSVCKMRVCFACHSLFVQVLIRKNVTVLIVYNFCRIHFEVTRGY